MYKMVNSPNNIVNKVLNDPTHKTTFQDLCIYFGELTINDISSEDLEEYINYTEPKHKILMSVFIHKHLIPYIEKHNQESFKSKESDYKLCKFQDGVFDGSFAFKSHILHINNKKDILELKSIFLETIKENKVKRIDLSRNGLYSSDLPFILEFLSDSEIKKYLEDTIVDLSDNKIEGLGEYRETVDTCIKSIVEIPEIKNLVIIGNPFATINRKDFFETLDINNTTKKLIWIRNYNINCFGWQDLLKSQEVIEYVKKSHLGYYQN